MKVLALHANFKMPSKGSLHAGAYDIYMPEAGSATDHTPTMVGLGFAAEVPPGHVALIFPRSGIGAVHGLELNNTCGVIDSDYRGEWKAALKTKHFPAFKWEAGERILQFLIVPVLHVELERVHKLGTSNRGLGGFGSTGKN